MSCFRHLFTAALACAAASPALGLPQRGDDVGAGTKALYFLQNNPAGSSLIALDVSNGQVADPVRIPTGGIGAAIVNDTSRQPVPIDTFNSQGAVAVGGEYLFTVNAGSNTLAMFCVHEGDPTHPQMVGSPVDTMGDFPLSVTYSDELKTVCVVNGGARNNVACFKVNDDSTLSQSGEVRSLGLELATPPLFNSGTVSQIQFSPDLKSVVVAVKGAMAGKVPGPIVVFPIEDGVVAQEAVASTIADLPVPFGFTFGESGDAILQSDPTFGGSVLSIDPTTHLTTELKHTSSPLNLSCWAAYSPTTKKGYLIDAMTPQMVEVDMLTGTFTDILRIDPAFKGSFDATIVGATVYFIAQVASVGVYDVAQKETLQNLDLTNAPGVDARQWWTGMAVWPSP